MQKKIKIDTRVLYKKICFTQPEETNISFHWFQNPPQIIRIEPGSSIIFSSVIQSLQFPPPKINIFATFKNQLIKYPSLASSPLYCTVHTTTPIRHSQWRLSGHSPAQAAVSPASSASAASPPHWLQQLLSPLPPPELHRALSLKVET